MIGYFHTPVLREYRLKVDDVHELYIEECGNVDGIPVVFLHGGPGGAISEASRRFFDPEKYHIILFDQRGCGKSTPARELTDNTTFASVADMEGIREHFGFDEWVVFGGSYGSTLALAYAIAHPERVTNLVLRGIFLGRQSDIDWMIERGGASEFFPKEHAEFASFVPEAERDNLVDAYYHRMTTGSEDSRGLAAKNWAEWESGMATIQPDFSGDADVKEWHRTIGLLEAHYFANGFFPGESDNYLLENIERTAGIPTEIVHGRFDTICRPSAAYELAEAMDSARLSIIEESSHSPSESHMFRELVEIMDRLAE